MTLKNDVEPENERKAKLKQLHPLTTTKGREILAQTALVTLSTALSIFSIAPASANGVLGKTIQNNYTWRACGPNGCTKEERGDAHIYIGLSGGVYDYVRGKQSSGSVSRLGVAQSDAPGSTITYTARGSTLIVTQRDRGGVVTTQYFAVDGNSCSLSIRGSISVVHFVVSDQVCKVVNGNVGR
jgi:hypothetical protein